MVDGMVLPKEMTQMAWKMPALMKRELLTGPLDSGGRCAPCVMTVITIMSMLTRARVDAFAS